MVPELLSVAMIVSTSACQSRETGETAEATTAASGSSTYDLPHCSGTADQTECTTMPGCAWMSDIGCIIDCEQVDDQHSCETVDYCTWWAEETSCLWAIA